ncbi:MAG: DUF1289 domain-containing protein [Methylocystis sp.]|uniref:DUF1289 domain-containing protein n=1 Tax=Methylocystis sp. TaxID=1911079 RepID=UPI003DA5D058
MVESPCNKICTLNADHVCVGCGRSRAEIGAWSQMSDAERRRVVVKAKARLAAMGGARKADSRVS